MCRIPRGQWLVSRHIQTRQVLDLTGKTRGMPPRAGPEPSNLAASLSQSFSSPEASFQLRTVAPCSKISTLSPVGRTAVSFPLPSVIVTVACGGKAGVAASAEGLLGLSTMLPIVRMRLVWMWCGVVLSFSCPGWGDGRGGVAEELWRGGSSAEGDEIDGLCS